MGRRRASFIGLLLVTVVASCGPSGPDVSSWELLSPTAPAAGWTVHTGAGMSNATPMQLALAVSPDGARVAGTLVSTYIGSTKGPTDPGRSGAYVWRCTGSFCQRVSGEVKVADLLAPTTTGFAAVSDADGGVVCVRKPDANRPSRTAVAET